MSSGRWKHGTGARTDLRIDGLHVLAADKKLPVGALEVQSEFACVHGSLQEEERVAPWSVAWIIFDVGVVVVTIYQSCPLAQSERLDAVV